MGVREIDVVVIGGGPAGLSAALWLGRYRREVLVLDSGEYRNRSASELHGYLGADGIDPAELRERAHRDLKGYPTVAHRCAEVRRAERTPDGFVVQTIDNAIGCRRVVVATGIRDRFPEVENFFDFYGTSVFTCPACDGYEAEGKHVVVLGWNAEIGAFAQHLLEWAASVTIVTEGRKLEADEPPDAAINVVERDATALLGVDGQLGGVRLDDGRQIPCEMAFFSIDQAPVTGFAEQLGCELNDEGCVRTDADGTTSVPGVYAAGDIVGGPQLVQVAAASGARAGIACARSLAT